MGLPLLPLTLAARTLGLCPPLPFNLTFSLSFRCNSRCRTCRVYERRSEELSAREWMRVFSGLGRAPLWATFSGGEPFLREDLEEIVTGFYDLCGPRAITLPTNGLLPGRVAAATRAILDHCIRARVIVNLSLDEIGTRHDRIRGVPGNWEKALETLGALKGLGRPNLTVGIHTVLSRENIDRFPEIREGLLALAPDSYVTEIAEERVELGTTGLGITPPLGAYGRAVEDLSTHIALQGFRGMGPLTRAFRLEYLRLSLEILETNRQVIPCYAGIASAHVAPNGDLWACCTLCRSMGNLRDEGFSFRHLWGSKEAKRIRQEIRQGRCACPLANAAYTNLLHSPRRMWRIAGHFLRARRG